MILVLHGWGQSGEYWRSIRSQFGPERIKILDLPGFGREPLISTAWTIPDYAEWVDKTVQDNGLSNIDLLGHSFGGRIASYLAAKSPSWLRSLILYGAPCVYRPSRKTLLKISLAKMAKRFVPPGIRKRAWSPDVAEAEKSGMGRIFRNTVGFDQTDILPKITVPTLLIWGEADTEVPVKIAKEMSGMILGSTLEILPGLGHNAHLENPDLFYGKIRSFLKYE